MDDVIADIHEILEKIEFVKPVYLAVLKRTKDKQQALEAAKLLGELYDSL